MEIGQTGQSVTANAQAQQNAVAATEISADFETFLTMLTAQMENQDPLNPLDSADFAVQLATFSGVEQQVRSNQLLEGLHEQLGQMGLAQLASWVGMEARVAAPAHFDGSPITLNPTPAAAADQAVLVVTDASGSEVDRVAITASNEPVLWAGVSAQGDPLPPGNYSFALESYRNGEKLGSEVLPVYSRITEARNEGGQVRLVLEGGVEVSASEISALRSGGG